MKPSMRHFPPCAFGGPLPNGTLAFDHSPSYGRYQAPFDDAKRDSTAFLPSQGWPRRVLRRALRLGEGGERSLTRHARRNPEG